MDVMFSSKDQTWCTPQELYDKLNKEFHFTLDAAASDANAKCNNYYTEENSGLDKSWAGQTVFCNPPYGREISLWVKKAYEEYRDHKVKTVMLIPARTDTSYWHEYIFPHAQIYFVPGRLKFTNQNGITKYSAPFPSAIIVFDPYNVSLMPFTDIRDILKGEAA